MSEAPTRPLQVVVLAGPSGSGKSRLARQLSARHGWPVVVLDDFYKDGSDPTLPRSADLGIPDWDHPDSWDSAAAMAALTTLCQTGRATTPRYDLSVSRAVGEQTIIASDGDLVVAEGIFAGEAIADLRASGLLHSAWCVRHPRGLTFLLRLARDLREHRKPAPTLLRRGLVLLRAEPQVVAALVAQGACPASPRRAARSLRPSR